MLRTVVAKQICAVFVVVIIQHVQIVKERLDLGLSTIDHVLSYYALLQLIALYIEGYLNYGCETCKGVIVICEVRRVESIESEKTSIESEENVCRVCGGDNSTCADCEGNIKPGFVINGSCDKFIDQLDGSRSARWLF